MGFRFHTVKIWTMYYGNRISVKRDTALKLTECTTDIEVIIKQVISADFSFRVTHNRQNVLCVLRY